MSNKRPPYLRPVEDGASADGRGVDAMLGDLITRYRTDRGLDQAQLAQRLGVSVAELEGYETGAIRLPASVLHALAHALGVPAAAFFR